MPLLGCPPIFFFGTGIPTCILVIKKCREVNDDVLFIDASNEFEKQGNQNKLLDAHITKIINTYTERKVIDKFSYRATLKEIADNDYNLNIPRYVDTFEEEDPIDILEVAKELKALETDMAETDATIADFCKQLNIETPF